MESDWQFLVAKMGLSRMGYIRAGRMLLLTNFYILEHEGRTSGDYSLFYWPDPDQLPTYIGEFATGGGWFPWGIPVAPD